MDNYKGILIFLVVLGHLLFSYDYDNGVAIMNVVKFIYSFHMPLFLIISGYFSKRINKKGNFRLLVLFVLLNFSYILYDYFVYGSFDFFTIKYSSWYLLALFLYRIIISLPSVNKFIIINKVFSLSFSFVVSIIIGLFNFNNLISKLVSYFLFFLVGYLLDNEFLESVNRRKSVNLVTLVFSLLFLGMLSFSLPFSLNFYMAGSYIHYIQVVFRLIIYIIDIMLFLSFLTFIPDKRVKFLTNIGRNSLSIYLGHRIFTLVITNHFIYSDYFIWIMLFSSFLLCLIFSSRLFERLFYKVYICIDKVYDNKFYYFVTFVLFSVYALVGIL